MTAPTAVDVDRLPPTQYLILEVLAARHRSGEGHWTFPARLTPAARRLEAADLVRLRSTPEGFEASLTAAGRAAVLSDMYTSPHAAPIERVRALCVAAEAAGTTLHPNQILAALGGR